MSLPAIRTKSLPAQKEMAENALTEAFALDLVTMDELEERLHKVQQARSHSEITSCLQDLPPQLLTSSREKAALKIEQREKKQTTVLSSNLLRGVKLKCKRLNIKNVLGEQTLDYSKTILKPGKYYVELTAVLADTKIIVPAGYAVTSDINNILSEVKDKTVTEPQAGAPEIIICGYAVLSSVTIREKGSGFIEKIKQLFLD